MPQLVMKTHTITSSFVCGANWGDWISAPVACWRGNITRKSSLNRITVNYADLNEYTSQGSVTNARQIECPISYLYARRIQTWRTQSSAEETKKGLWTLFWYSICLCSLRFFSLVSYSLFKVDAFASARWWTHWPWRDKIKMIAGETLASALVAARGSLQGRWRKYFKPGEPKEKHDSARA